MTRWPGHFEEYQQNVTQPRGHRNRQQDQVIFHLVRIPPAQLWTFFSRIDHNQQGQRPLRGKPGREGVSGFSGMPEAEKS